MCSSTWIFSWVISGSVLRNALVPWGLTSICGPELNFREPLGTSLIISGAAPCKQGCGLNAACCSSGRREALSKANQTASFLHLDSAFFPLFFFSFPYSEGNLKNWAVSRPYWCGAFVPVCAGCFVPHLQPVAWPTALHSCRHPRKLTLGTCVWRSLLQRLLQLLKHKLPRNRSLPKILGASRNFCSRSASPGVLLVVFGECFFPLAGKSCPGTEV